MPRARKTQTGDKAMSIQQVPGQQYGAQTEQVALQRAMPAPQVSPAAGTIPTSPTPPTDAASPPMAAPSAAPAPTDPMAAFAALRDRVGTLDAPTARPAEPITAGLASGPGPGPEVLQMQFGSPLGDTLRRLSDTLGDQFYAQLAQQAGL